MATLTILLCDECGREVRRLVEIDHRSYCSRDCYLSACKRLFDERWFEMLKTSEHVAKPQIVVSNIA